jgi:hypothetical protein
MGRAAPGEKKIYRRLRVTKMGLEWEIGRARSLKIKASLAAVFFWFSVEYPDDHPLFLS